MLTTLLYILLHLLLVVFQVLLLQKPHAKSKSRDHVHCLECHLDLWHHGDITALVKEAKCIQDHLQSTIQSGLNSSNVARSAYVIG